RDVYGGAVPDNMDDLLTLPGIGRKTANLLLGDVFGKPAVVTDTHCIRISGRLGLTKRHAPEQVEEDLRKVLPPERSNRFCHQLVLFGRDTCTARTPRCGACPLKGFCKDPGFKK
ncbi:MAG: endonuclease III, partial [Oscillospiraceae bacterium]|nr:endonuclease III [Oscillospiraceae bacterium]